MLWLLACCLGAVVLGEARAADRFAAAGVSERSVRRAFDALQNGVRAGDPGPVADLVAYPLRINHANGTRDVIDNLVQLVTRFSALFGGKMREIILAQRFDDLAVSAHGIMFGTGDLWLSGICDKPGCSDPRIAIIAINTP